MVVFDPDMGTYYWQFCADPDCDGAIEAGDGPAVIFQNRTEAKLAIRISRNNAILQKSQGKVYNRDFIEELKSIKIVPVACYAKGGEA